MEYKKSYKGFIIWLIAFLTVSIGVALIPEDAVSAAFLMRVVGNICTISIAILAFVICETECVYWYTGISYEDAVKAGSEKRREYAWKHFQRFGTFAVIYLVISIAAQLLQINMWVDLTFLFVGVIAVAVSTIRIKL